jgi:hypothetical protein
MNSIGVFDMGASLGDMQAEFFSNDYSWYIDCISKTKYPWITVVGNHDAGNTDSTATSGTKEQVFEKIVNPTLQYAEVDSSTSYYYKDFNDKKIRVIVLNSSDLPNELIDSNHFAVSRGVVNCYSNEQIEWFVNTLNTTPTEYHVVILTHVSPSYLEADMNIPFQNDVIASQHFGEAGAYPSIIPDIIQAWIDGDVISKTYSSNVVNLPNIIIEHDFSTRGNGVFVGYFCGHLHYDLVGKLRDYPTQNSFILNTTSAKLSSDISRKIGTKSEDCITAISIDTITRKIYTVRVGAKITDKFGERKFFVVGY